MTIPLILAYAFSSILGGIAVTNIGYYTPFMIATSIFMAVGAGLMSTFTVDSGAGAWIGYQILFGIGLGMGADLPLVAAQVVLPLNQVQTATALLMFFQTLGATVFISVSQNVFVNRLILHLRQLLPNLDPQIVINAGATNLKLIIDVSDTPNLLVAYNRALNEMFLVPTIMASFTVIGSLLMEWKSVKEPKAEEGQLKDQAGTSPQSFA